MQFGITLGEKVSCLHEIAFLGGDVLALGNEVFLGVSGLGGDHQLAFALGFSGEGDDPVDFGDDGLLLGLSDLEELGHARQTADDVLGLGAFAGLSGDDVARLDLVPVLDHENGSHGQGEDGLALGSGPHLGLALIVRDGDGGLVVGGPVLHDGEGGPLGDLVGLLLKGLALQDVGELDLSGHIRDERLVEGVPLGQGRTLLDSWPSSTMSLAPEGRMYFSLSRPCSSTTLICPDLPRTISPSTVLDAPDARQGDAAGILGLDGGLLDLAGGRAADVEGAHGQLRAGFADGLSRDDAHGLAHIDELPRARSRP